MQCQRLIRVFVKKMFEFEKYLRFLFVNYEKRRLLCSLWPNGLPQQQQQQQQQQSQSGNSSSTLSAARKSDLLRFFYRSTVGAVLPDDFAPTPHAVDADTGDFPAHAVPHARLRHPVSESYLSTEFHKCVAVQHRHCQLFAIFVAAVPNHSMRCV